MKEKIMNHFLLFLNIIMAIFLLILILQPLTGENMVSAATVGQNSIDYNSFVFRDSSRCSGEAVENIQPIKDVQKEEKICYLTFDDGPSLNTLSILDILKEYNAKATFFIIGNTLTEDNRYIVERIISEGHLIGLHANNHNYSDFYKDDSSWLADYEMLYTRLKEEYNITPDLFRFPGGSACTFMSGKSGDYVQIMKDKGFSCFDWNVSGEDSVGSPTPLDIYDNVLKDAIKYNTPIVLLHDSAVSGNTVTALPLIMEKLDKEGYVFHTLENRKEYIFRSTLQ